MAVGSVGGSEYYATEGNISEVYGGGTFWAAEALSEASRRSEKRMAAAPIG